jgi:hypothetical protein
MYGQDVPRADIFLGYSFLRANSAREVPAFTMNGGLGALGINFNRHVGLEFEFGGYHNGNISGIQFDTTTMTYMFGPRFSVGRDRKVDPYFHVLFGGMHLSTSIAADPTATPVATVPASGRRAASQDAFSMAAGGGLDIRLGRHVSFRPIQLDWVMSRLEDFGLSGAPSQNRNQHHLRYAAGFMFMFGGEKPAPPPPPPPATKPCPGGTSVPIDQECPRQNMSIGAKASQTEVCAGTAVTITPAANIPSDATLQWTVNGQPASQASVFDFQTGGLAAGTYRIGLKATAPNYNEGSAETVVTVRGYTPPTGTVQATPSEAWVGDKVSISTSFQPGQCGGALQPASISASEGTIGLAGDSFDTNSVRFDPSVTSEQQKSIVITATVSDGKGSGTAQTTLVVKKKGAMMAKRLPDILFPRGSARVNNCGKRVLLEELKVLTQGDPTGTVIFVGHQTEKEARKPGLDEKRALNAAAVISAGQGICTAFPASQIQISATGSTQSGVEPQPNFCGTSATEKPGQGVVESDEEAKYRRVEVWFVPTGGLMPASLGAHRDAVSASVGAIGCPK